jgi:Zn-dependent membrane protease YugP
MNPVLILLPALGLLLGPRLWVARVIRQHDAEDERPDAAREVARALLDRHGLRRVRVEPTDGSDHYDPRARVVRLSRHNFERKSLAAVTTAAHEVAHAVQHATGYAPFAWRTRLARIAQVTGEAGSVLLIAVPVTFLLTRQPLPRNLLAGAAMGMLGTSTAAQIAALPTELDASFKRALPMLKDGYIEGDQVEAAHRILYACSLTYFAASFAGVLHIWPWVRPGFGTPRPGLLADAKAPAPAGDPAGDALSATPTAQARRRPTARRTARNPQLEQTLRAVAKPLIRRWLRLVS